MCHTYVHVQILVYHQAAIYFSQRADILTLTFWLLLGGFPMRTRAKNKRKTQKREALKSDRKDGIKWKGVGGGLLVTKGQ